MISESAARRLSGSSPIPDFISLRYIAECGWSETNGQAQNSNIWTVAAALPWTPSRVRWPVEPALFAFSNTAHGKECGIHHWYASLCIRRPTADPLMMMQKLSVTSWLWSGTKKSCYAKFSTSVKIIFFFSKDAPILTTQSNTHTYVQQLHCGVFNVCALWES